MFGDDIDDAAWEALGPRPADSEPLRFDAIRLADFWVVDPVERRQRENLAAQWTRTADVSYETGGGERLDLYLDAIRVAPLYMDSWSGAVRGLLALDEFRRAHALAQQYCRLAPEDARAWYVNGKCMMHVGEFGAARANLSRSLSSPDHPQPDAATTLALLYLQEGDVAAAESVLTRYDVDDGPVDLLLQAEYARLSGDLQRATELVERAARDPQAPTGTREELASLYYEQGDLQAARATYEQILQQTPSRTAPAIGLARVELALGDIDAAERRLRRAIARQPYNMAAHFNLGAALLERARIDNDPSATYLYDAEWSLTRCVDTDFELPASLWGRAELRLRRRDRDTAQEDFDRIRIATPQQPADTTRWAKLLIVTGYKDDATTILRDASRRSALDAEGLALLAQRQEPGDPNALANLRRAFEHEPQNAAIGMRLGVALLQAGELEDAERTMRTVVALRPDDPAALQNLAAVLDRRKKYREAQELLLRAESLRKAAPRQ